MLGTQFHLGNKQSRNLRSDSGSDLPMPADELKVNDPLGSALLTPLSTFSRPKSRLVTTKCCSEKGRVFRSPGVSSKSPISCTRSWGDGDTKPVAHASERLYEVIPSHREQTKETVWVIQVVLDGIPWVIFAPSIQPLRGQTFSLVSRMM